MTSLDGLEVRRTGKRSSVARLMTTPLPVRGDRLLLKVEQRVYAGELMVALRHEENGAELRSRLAPQAKDRRINKRRLS